MVPKSIRLILIDFSKWIISIRQYKGNLWFAFHFRTSGVVLNTEIISTRALPLLRASSQWSGIRNYGISADFHPISDMQSLSGITTMGKWNLYNSNSNPHAQSVSDQTKSVKVKTKKNWVSWHEQENGWIIKAYWIQNHGFVSRNSSIISQIKLFNREKEALLPE